MTEPLKKTDPQIVKELAQEAESLKANRAFSVAVAMLQKQWYGEFLNPETDDETARMLRAKLTVLEAIPQMLDHLIASQVMALRGLRRG